MQAIQGFLKRKTIKKAEFENIQKEIEAIRKPKNEKTEEDLNILANMVAKTEFFKRIHESEREKVVKGIVPDLEYEFVKQDKPVFVEGSIGYKFYIIIEGKVDVLTKPSVLSKKQGKIKVGECVSGQSFGELAIMGEHIRPRTATIICTKDCHFATLNRDYFLKFLGSIKEDISVYTQKLAKNPIFAFNLWGNRSLESWVKTFKHYKYQKGNILYNEGDESTHIYFLFNGSVVCSQRFLIPKTTEFNQNFELDKHNKISEVKMNEKYFQKDYAILTEGTLLGEEETFEAFKQETKLYDVKEKIRKEIRLRFQEERNLQNLHKESYDPPDDIKLPINPKFDNQAIENLVQERISSMITDIPRRKYTVTVYSSEAEIWKIERTSFFQQFEDNFIAIRELKNLIQLKQQHRQTQHLSAFHHLPQLENNMLIKTKGLIKFKSRTPKNKNIVLNKDENCYQDVIDNLKLKKELDMNKKNQSIGFQKKSNPIVLAEELANRSSTSFYIQNNSVDDISKAMEPLLEINPDGVYEYDKLNASYYFKSIKKNQISPRKIPSKNTTLNSFGLLKFSKQNIRSQSVPRKNNRYNVIEPENSYLIVDNPLPGISINRPPWYKDINCVPRISSKDRGQSFEADRFYNDILNSKDFQQQKLLNQSPFRTKMNEKFFDKQSMHDSNENFSEAIKNYVRIKQTKSELRGSISSSPNRATNTRWNKIDLSSPKRINKSTKLPSNLFPKQDRSLSESFTFNSYQEEKSKKKLDSRGLSILTEDSKNITFHEIEFVPSSKDKRASKYKDISSISDISKTPIISTASQSQYKGFMSTKGSTLMNKSFSKDENFTRDASHEFRRTKLNYSVEIFERDEDMIDSDQNRQFYTPWKIHDPEQRNIPWIKPLTTKHRALAKKYSNVFNKKPLLDKARILLERLDRSSTKSLNSISDEISTEPTRLLISQMNTKRSTPRNIGL